MEKSVAACPGYEDHGREVEGDETAVQMVTYFWSVDAQPRSKFLSVRTLLVTLTLFPAPPQSAINQISLPDPCPDPWPPNLWRFWLLMPTSCFKNFDQDHIHSCPHLSFLSFFFFYKLIYFNWRLITLQCCSGFAIHWHENQSHSSDCQNHPSDLPIRWV